MIYILQPFPIYDFIFKLLHVENKVNIQQSFNDPLVFLHSGFENINNLYIEWKFIRIFRFNFSDICTQNISQLSTYVFFRWPFISPGFYLIHVQKNDFLPTFRENVWLPPRKKRFISPTLRSG